MTGLQKTIVLPLALLVVAGISGCGGSDEATTTDLAPIASIASGTSGCSAKYPESPSGWYASKTAKYKGDTQCLTQIQAAESYRTSAIANCAAGSTVGAEGNYKYYKTSVSYAGSICP